MTYDEICEHKVMVDDLIDKNTRGKPDLTILGAATMALWEIALQLARMNHYPPRT